MVLINLTSVFYLLIVIFGIVGAMRGWAKEILALFAIVLAMFVVDVLENLIPFIKDALSASDPAIHFWIRAIILIALAFFGYQSPNLSQFEGKTKSERIQDRLLGLILGLANGYLIAGTLWFYLDQAGYPFKDVFFMPSAAECIPRCIPKMLNAEEWNSLIANLPPAKLAGPTLYIAVAIAFLFIVIVFI
jgi:uncharacterized membrane protein required for colicin V production